MGHSRWLKLNEDTILPLFTARSKSCRDVPRRCTKVPHLGITLARLTKLLFLITISNCVRSLPISANSEFAAGFSCSVYTVVRKLGRKPLRSDYDCCFQIFSNFPYCNNSDLLIITCYKSVWM